MRGAALCIVWGEKPTALWRITLPSRTLSSQPLSFWSGSASVNVRHGRNDTAKFCSSNAGIGSGYAGVEHELFPRHMMMLFADAKNGREYPETLDH